jgi:hypothetical protein
VKCKKKIINNTTKDFNLNLYLIADS